MSFRVSALVATLAVLGSAEGAPAFAQPPVPVRPRYSAFQNIFRPGVPPLVQPGPGFLGQPLPMGNPAGPLAPGFVYPNLATQPQALPGAAGNIDPQARPTGIVGQFVNYGNWYGNGSGSNYGHWYPNGIANGRGILGGSGGAGVSAGGSMPSIGPRPTGGSVLGTAVTAGAVVGTLRR